MFFFYLYIRHLGFFAEYERMLREDLDIFTPNLKDRNKRWIFPGTAFKWTLVRVDASDLLYRYGPDLSHSKTILQEYTWYILYRDGKVES